MENPYQKQKVLVEVLRAVYEKEHFHQEIELLYVLEGRLTVYADDRETVMDTHDILIINAGRRHTLKGTEDVLYLKLMVQYNMIADIVDFWDVVFWCDSTRHKDDAYKTLAVMLQKLLGHYLTNRGNSANFAHIALCYQILDFICARFLVRSSAAQDEGSKFNARIAMIENYIQSNYDAAISLKDLSEKLYLSTGYLTRFFRKAYGMTFGDYLTKVRLSHAMEELLYSEASVARIVYDNGFANVSLFNKAFKDEYGETPGEVRKRAGKINMKTEEPLPEEMRKRLENYLWSETDSPVGAENTGKIEAGFSVKESSELAPFWNVAVNIGSAADLFQSAVQEHVAYLGRTMGFRYVRFWHPFSREMLIDVNSESGFNFSRLDAVLDFLIENRLHPLIDFAEKPRRVDKNERDSLLIETVETIQSAQNYARVLEAFLRHVLDRYGRREVEEWKFEHTIPFGDIGDELKLSLFMERFRISRKTIREHLERAELGGCGLHGHAKYLDLLRNYTERFQHKMLSMGCMPDYISMFLFPYDDSPDTDLVGNQLGYRRSSDRDWVRHSVEVFRKEAPEIQEKGIKAYVTEWNLTRSQRNFLNDSCFKGAYIVRTVISMIGEIDALVYFWGSDRAAEFFDTSDCLFGGAGLLSRDGIVKPAGFAFEFLNRLYRRMIGKGENYIVTTDGHGKYRILCHNMRSLNYNYFMEDEDKLDRGHMKKYFEDLDPLELNIRLSDVEDGDYHLKCYRVNEQYGSVFHHWGELGFTGNLQKNDIRYLRKVCEPNLSIHCVKTENGKINVRHTLLANEIALLQLVRKQ